MKFDKKKVEMAMAVAMKSPSDIAAEGNVSLSTVQRVLYKEADIRPKTAGIIAKSLNVSIKELLKEE